MDADGLAREVGEPGCGGLHHRRVEPVEERAGAGIEGAELRRRPGPGEIADRLGVTVRVVPDVEAAPIGPEMAREERLADEGHVVVEPLAACREERVEDRAHGQHRGPRRDGPGL